MTFSKYVDECLYIFDKIKNDTHIIIVANNDNNYVINETMDNLLKLCNKYGISSSFYTDEKEFITLLQSHDYKNLNKKVFVYNRMSDGQWGERRVLIPSLCKHYNIPYFGHNSYVMGLLCNKIHYTCILNQNNISVPESWTYNYQNGWISGKPKYGQKIIIKPAYENNSSSIKKESVFIFNELNTHLIHELSIHYNQPIIVQKFIQGYELSIPVFTFKNEVIIPFVLGSKLNGDLKFGEYIISESLNIDRRYSNMDEKYFDFSEINDELTQNIIKDSKKIVKALHIDSISRFDLRVDESFEYYFNDLGSIPGFLPKSSFAFVFNKFGHTYDDFLKCSIVSDYIKFYPI
jgi:D-alanine-D-alanine ligase-like ATP-grasp enzyme